MEDIFVEIDELFGIVMELDARNSCNNIAFQKYRHESWDGLCKKGIDILKRLQEE